jgi:hypothetical protein
LPETDAGIVEQQSGNDGKIRPIAAQRGDDGGGFDEEGERSPEVGKKLVPLAFRPVFQSVAAVLRQPPFCLRRAQAILGGIGRVECGRDLSGGIARRLLCTPVAAWLSATVSGISRSF